MMENEKRDDVAANRQRQANQTKAQDFLRLKPEDAIKKHPDLINAYGVVKASELVAKDNFIQTAEQKKFIGVMKETVAQRIEKGKEIPQLKIKGQHQGRTAEPERDR